ncbi:MAG: hypothetical protein ACLFWM_09540 [Actinomycetota bacterium]
MIERLLVVAAVAAVVVALAVLLRRRPLVRRRRLGRTDLPPGLYLLTSDGCGTCGRARERLVRRDMAHTELSWEKNPEVFETLGIDAVPSVVRIHEDGTGLWWRGGVPLPSRRFR